MENEEYFNEIKRNATKHVYSKRGKEAIIHKGQLGRDAVEIGTAVEVFQSFFGKAYN